MVCAVSLSSSSLESGGEEGSIFVTLPKRILQNGWEFLPKIWTILTNFMRNYLTYSRLSTLHRCFPVNFAKFLRTPFFTGHLWWLLLRVVLALFCWIMKFFYEDFLSKSQFLCEEVIQGNLHFACSVNVYTVHY